MKYTNLKKGDILIHKNNNRKITLENDIKPDKTP